MKHLVAVVLLVSVKGLDLNIDDKHITPLGACQACKTVVKSFQAAMEKTSRGYHEGGDAEWEEKKLKNYAHSEVRLAEIQSLLCEDVTIGKSQCHQVASDAEEALEAEWWPAEPRPDLHAWLCVERRRVCCPDGHFGPVCQTCPGGAEQPCSGHGRCKGDGTRKGNGACVCNQGYAGSTCRSCNLTDHYEAYKDDTKLVCSPCHKACDGACAGAGPKHCVRCATGYEWLSELGCSDVDECLKPDTCRRDQLCVNDPGKFTCMDCDKSCDTCHGDGPDMCHACAEGYVKKGKLCVDKTVAEREGNTTEEVAAAEDAAEAAAADGHAQPPEGSSADTASVEGLEAEAATHAEL